MPARARIDHIAPFDRLGIWLGRTSPDISVVFEPALLTSRLVSRDEVVTTMEPSLMLDEDVARALLDALAVPSREVGDADGARPGSLH